MGGLDSRNRQVSLATCVLNARNNSVTCTEKGGMQGLAAIVAVFVGIINHHRHQNHAYCYYIFRITVRWTGIWQKSAVNHCLPKPRESILKVYTPRFQFSKAHTCVLLGQTPKAISSLQTQQGAWQKFAVGWESPKAPKLVQHLPPYPVSGILGICLHFQAPKHTQSK